MLNSVCSFVAGPCDHCRGGKGRQSDSLITNAAKDLSVYQSEPRALPQETGAITMNPLAHVTQAHTAKAQAHQGRHNPPISVDIYIHEHH